GSNPLRLTDNPAMESWPACSADGTRIAYVSDRDGNFEIYVMDTDGSNLVRLTDNLAYDVDPAWSPGSQQR
ncbi:MAG: PD40 domain-containing protein, partial [Gemmatimonadota bacterium]